MDQALSCALHRHSLKRSKVSQCLTESATFYVSVCGTDRQQSIFFTHHMFVSRLNIIQLASNTIKTGKFWNVSSLHCTGFSQINIVIDHYICFTHWLSAIKDTDSCQLFLPNPKFVHHRWNWGGGANRTTSKWNLWFLSKYSHPVRFSLHPQITKTCLPTEMQMVNKPIRNHSNTCSFWSLCTLTHLVRCWGRMLLPKWENFPYRCWGTGYSQN